MSSQSKRQLNQESAERGLTADNFLRELTTRKWLVVILIVVPLILAFVLVSFSPRHYKATAVVVPVHAEDANLGALAGELGGLAAMLGAGTLSSANSTQESLAILKSRSFLAGFLVESDAISQVRERVWPKGVRVGIPLIGKRRDMVVEDAVDYFESRMLQVTEDRFSGVIRISLEWPDREKVAAWTNRLVSHLNQFSRETAKLDAKKSLEFLNAEVASTTQLELRNSLFTLIENQKHKEMLATVREEYVFKVIDPAVVPQADRYSRPKPLRMILVAVALGIVAAFSAVAILVMKESLSRSFANSAAGPDIP